MALGGSVFGRGAQGIQDDLADPGRPAPLHDPSQHIRSEAQCQAGSPLTVIDSGTMRGALLLELHAHRIASDKKPVNPVDILADRN